MIDHKEFIKYWNNADSAMEVGSKFGVSTNYARIRANFLRQLGYKLKRFDRRKQNTHA